MFIFTLCRLPFHCGIPLLRITEKNVRLRIYREVTRAVNPELRQTIGPKIDLPTVAWPQEYPPNLSLTKSLVLNTAQGRIRCPFETWRQHSIAGNKSMHKYRFVTATFVAPRNRKNFVELYRWFLEGAILEFVTGTNTCPAYEWHGQSLLIPLVPGTAVQSHCLLDCSSKHSSLTFTNRTVTISRQ